MTAMAEPISRHFLRRTARAKANWMDGSDPTSNYTVRRYRGRLFKWQVVRIPKKHGPHVTGDR